MDGCISHIQKKLSSQLDRQWTVEEMADEAGLSTPHFQKLFRKEANDTPIAYLNELRLAKAHELLSDPECFDRIKEIRVRCGLLNDSNFTRDFTLRFGLNPTECRHGAWELDQSTPPNE